MADTSSRTLRLLALLQRHRHWSGEGLADALGVSIRTVRRDIDRLRELGYPVEASRGVDGGYELAPGAVLPPLVLDDEEAVALAVGLQASTMNAPDGVGEASARALAKVVQVMPKALGRRVEAVLAATAAPEWLRGGPAIDPLALATLAQACRDAERVSFDYAAADGARTSREAEPLRLVPLWRRWYLVAYDLQRHDWRTFRLDRLSAPRPSGQRFRPRELPGGADPATFVQERMSRQGATRVAEVIVHADAEQVRAGVDRWGKVEPLDDARCTLRVEADSLRWVVLLLGSVEAEFEVVSPPELLQMLDEWAARFGRATTASAVAAHAHEASGVRTGHERPLGRVWDMASGSAR